MPEEAGVALVGVEHLGLRRAGEAGVDPQRPHATDAEQQLLAQTVLGGAAVQPVGDLDVVVGVALDVGVEHQQRHPPDRGHPDPGEQVGPVGLLDRDGRRAAVGLAQQRDRQLVGVEDRVGLLLPALARERLLEVAVAVEQADADDRHAEVAGGLEVVAGEDAEPAGVLRQHRGDAELGREVGDRPRRLAGSAALVPAVLAEVRRQVGPGGTEALRGSRRRRPARRAARRRPLRGARPGRGRWTPTARGRPRRRRPASRGARTTAGCRRARPGRRARDGRTGRTVNRRMARTG